MTLLTCPRGNQEHAAVKAKAAPLPRFREPAFFDFISGILPASYPQSWVSGFLICILKKSPFKLYDLQECWLSSAFYLFGQSQIAEQFCYEVFVRMKDCNTTLTLEAFMENTDIAWVLHIAFACTDVSVIHCFGSHLHNSTPVADIWQRCYLLC